MNPNKTYKKQTLIFLTILTILLLSVTINAEENSTTPKNLTTIENLTIQCFDNIDNDNDTLLDAQDPGCENPEDNTEIDCYMNTDCGIDECAGDENYCDNNDVYQIYRFFTCNNPGENNASCSNHTGPFLIFDCGESYCEEYTENYCHQDNVYKNRICYEKGCADKECINNEIKQEKLVKECKNGCKNNKCKSKETGKWRDYPNDEPEQEPQIKTTISKPNYTLLQESIQKVITMPNKEIKTTNKKSNWIIIFVLLITALLIFILTYLLNKNTKK